MAVVPAFLVVGQLAEVGERLQPPGLVVAAVGQQQAGEVEIEARHIVVRPIGRGQRHRLHHQLQGAHAVALERVDRLSAAAMLAAIELAGDDEAVVLDGEVCLGGRPEEPPVLGMRADDGLAEVVELVDPAELLQGGGRLGQIVADLAGIVGRIEGQLAKALVGVLEVARFELLLESRPIGRGRGFLGKCRGNAQPGDDGQSECDFQRLHKH